MKSVNPASGKLISEYAEHTAQETEGIIAEVHTAWKTWRGTSIALRKKLMLNAAQELRTNKEHYATLMTLEMGKLMRESVAEIEKCAWVCEFYAEKAEEFLQDESIVTDAKKSFVCFQPLGVILAVMPWNFPFWQVFRFAAPALMAGNASVLKHASNVPGCALAIEQIFKKAGFPENLFRTLMIRADLVEGVIRHPLVKAVTLTGSEDAGSRVASAASAQIKKAVLELGGSDPFIVLEDADLEKAISTAVNARMINQGQSCIAAKRFIVVKEVLEPFIDGLKRAFESLTVGDPLEASTQVGPMARADLVDDINRQVQDSIKSGAKLITGGKRIDRAGYYYQPTILSDVSPGMAAYHEELFGPVAAVIPVDNEQQAVEVANDSDFGLGGCVWTTNLQRGENVARMVESGAVFVNGMSKSDPRLPFGGIKKSGYGRELSAYGIKEFVNIKTIWIAWA